MKTSMHCLIICFTLLSNVHSFIFQGRLVETALASHEIFDLLLIDTFSPPVANLQLPRVLLTAIIPQACCRPSFTLLRQHHAQQKTQGAACR